MRIFVAGPYGDEEDFFINEINIKLAELAGRLLLKCGHEPHIPHKAFAKWQYDKEMCLKDWVRGDNAFLKVCDAVLRIPGKSPGADKEEELAKSLKIPVYHNFEDLLKDIGHNDYKDPKKISEIFDNGVKQIRKGINILREIIHCD